MKSLAQAILKLKTEEEVNNFLHDLCSPGEINDFNDRWRIAQMINGGKLSYREIAVKTSASTTTIARVARFLRQEPYQGYALALSRLARHHRSGK